MKRKPVKTNKEIENKSEIKFDGKPDAKSIARSVGYYMGIALIILLAYTLQGTLFAVASISKIQMGMIVALLVTGAVFVWIRGKGKLTDDRAVFLLIVVGWIMRIGYMLYTPCNIRSHDLGKIDVNGYMHAAYLLQLIKNGHLPGNNWGQFYQQPLFYLLGAGISKILNGIMGRTADIYLVDAAKTVSCFASCALLLLVNDFGKFLKQKRNGRLLAMAIIVFLPQYYLLAGRVNVDSLAVFLMAGAILYTFRWQQDKTVKNTVILALFYGLGMMTKITCGVIAVFTAWVMLKALLKDRKTAKKEKILPKLFLFGAISFPLGLWYSIRNYRLFGQELTYVVGVANGPDSDLYVGNVPYFQRFVSLDLSNLFATPYASPVDNYNYPVYLLKTALFGEFTYNVEAYIPTILLFTGFVLTVLFVFCWLFVKKEGVYRQLSAVSALLLLFGVYFNVSSPYGCSMDFRYLAVLPVPWALLSGYLFDKGEEVKIRLLPFNREAVWYGKYLAVTGILAFSLFSVLMYVNIR